MARVDIDMDTDSDLEILIEFDNDSLEPNLPVYF